MAGLGVDDENGGVAQPDKERVTFALVSTFSMCMLIMSKKAAR